MDAKNPAQEAMKSSVFVRALAKSTVENMSPTCGSIRRALRHACLKGGPGVGDPSVCAPKMAREVLFV